MQSTLGAAHPRHGSPFVASALQSAITVSLVLLFYFFTAVAVPDAAGNPVDTPALVPYACVYGLLALIGTAAILLVQMICSIAVIWYFWVRKAQRGNVITTLVCPLLGGAAMGYVVWLLWDNRTFAAGYAADSMLLKLAPLLLATVFSVGLVYALWLRGARPDAYAEIGRTVLPESRERG
jgi:nucleoside recognition membrane protein YjiH